LRNFFFFKKLAITVPGVKQRRKYCGKLWGRSGKDRIEDYVSEELRVRRKERETDRERQKAGLRTEGRGLRPRQSGEKSQEAED